MLEANLDSIDTSIPCNCHVLAGTYYLLENGQKEYLTQRIRGNPIWKSNEFWERTLSQYIQYNVVQLNESEQLHSATQENQRMQQSVIITKYSGQSSLNDAFNRPPQDQVDIEKYPFKLSKDT